MINKIIEKFLNKNVAIVGFGLEGKSSYNFIRKYSDMKLTILDKNEKILEDDIFQNDANVEFVCGEDYLNYLNEYDVLMKSPGVYIDDENLVSKITSQLDILLEFYSENVVAITGTKGKSTVSTLIYKGIKSSGKKVLFLGNIGKPIFCEIDKIDRDTIVVVEASALQLQYVNASPHIAVLLNLLEDHLDYFKTVETYHNAKLNICTFQKNSDYLIYLDSQINIYEKTMNVNSIKKIISYNGEYGSVDNKKITLPSLKIIGENNKTNALIALEVCEILNCDESKVKEALSNFNGLEHRMEFAGKYDDILFYNDMISTIPEATISAVKSLENVSTIIIGGMNRGINYSSLI